jgi:methionyl-tRNA synthetase
MITFDEFQKVDLRTAKVIEASPHPNADKLLLIRVDMGEAGERQLVAGIRSWYAPEDLAGKTVVVVANLAPAKLRGEESHGMLLAVQDGDDVRVVTTDGDVRQGLRVI